MNYSFIKHHRISIIMFAIGVAMALLFAFIPVLHNIINSIDRLGYLGMLIGGIMYGSSLAGTTAIIVFVESEHTLNPIMVGLIGGLGAALYDTAVFLIVRREGGRGWLAKMIQRIKERRHVPDWVSLVIGFLIIASPFPDELAAGLLGITNGKTVPFILTSFAANTVGVLALSRF